MNVNCFSTAYKNRVISKDFIFRRLQSLSGVAFTLFLCEHLLTNSLSPLFVKEGNFFVKIVNKFHQIPYLGFIEVFLLACPFVFHALLGIRYILSAKFCSFPRGNEQPYLNYERNHAFFLQRSSAWILLVGVLVHVIHMRFIECPRHIVYDNNQYYVTAVKSSPYLQEFAKKNQFILIYPNEKNNCFLDFSSTQSIKNVSEFLKISLISNLMKKESIKNNIIAVQKEPGKVFLLVLWNTFSSYIMCFLYSILVLVSVYHGCNGVWLFMMRWGFIEKEKTQKLVLKLIFIMMGLLSLLGLFAVWGMFWSVMYYNG